MEIKDYKYILDGKTPVIEPDLMKWAEWLETSSRHVGDDYIQTPKGEVRVSTVFLGIDHNLLGDRPMLFETAVFRDDRGVEIANRYETWEQAEKGHARTLKRVLKEYKIVKEIK